MNVEMNVTNEDRVNRGERAKEWLNQQLTQEVLATVRKAALDGLLASKFNDVEQLVYFRLYAKMCDEIEQTILNIMNDGALAANEIRMAAERDKLERAYPAYRRFR